MAYGVSLGLQCVNFFCCPSAVQIKRSRASSETIGKRKDLLSMYSSRNSPAVMGGLLDIIGTVEGDVFDERQMQGFLEGKGRDERMEVGKAERLCVCVVCVCGYGCWVWKEGKTGLVR